MKLLVLITKGIIRDVSTRRWAMFATVLTALFLLFLGSTFLAPFLSAHPILLVLYWLGCLWLTVLSILLAAYDLLSVGAAARAERRRLRKDVFGKPGDDE